MVCFLKKEPLPHPRRVVHSEIAQVTILFLRCAHAKRASDWERRSSQILEAEGEKHAGERVDLTEEKLST